MRRIIAMFVSVSLLLGVFVLTVSAEDTEITNQCGDNLTWDLTDGVFITGTGAMYDYSPENRSPWARKYSITNRAKIDEGVTSIGDYAFYDIHIYDRIIISSTVNSVGEAALAGGGAAYYFFGAAPEFDPQAFQLVRDSVIYTVGWDDSVKQDYGGRPEWKEAVITLDIFQSKLFYQLNEPINTEQLHFTMEGTKGMQYVPREIIVGSYDNSTYGEKQVQLMVDGHAFTYTYFVSDGKNHLDLINVSFGELAEYSSGLRVSEPIVKLGSVELIKGEHYKLTTQPVTVGNDGIVTVSGCSFAEGFERSFYAPVLKQDISDFTVSVGEPIYFTGMPVAPTVSARAEDRISGLLNKDYQAFYEENVNLGPAVVRVVGIGNCYGEARTTFNIVNGSQRLSLAGKQIGTVDGELSEDIPVYQEIIRPAKFTGTINTLTKHLAAYALYQIVGEEMVLLGEHVSQLGTSSKITCDFSSVYEDAKEEGGLVFLLTYSWVDETDAVYAGMTFLFVPAKVMDATSMTLHRAEDGDFRKDYLSLSGDDGVLGEIQWSSSDPSVATVEQGVVTLHKPGTVQITGQYGNMSQSCEIHSPTLDLTKGIIFDYDSHAGTARVIWESRLLTEGTDYTLSLQPTAHGTQITATGCGLFTGQLVKTFEGMDSLANPHTHSFDSVCDGTCNGCDYTRGNDHSFAQEWSKDQTQHWHACTNCGLRADTAAHTFVSENECEICGTLYMPGDLNCDDVVDNRDVEFLLWHTLFSENYPLPSDADYDHSGSIDNKDVEYLLWHTLFAENYPL